MALLNHKQPESHRVLSEKSQSNTKTCPRQNEKLNLIFSVGSASMAFGGLPSGILVDTLGPLVTAFVSCLLLMSGSILVAFANSVTFDVFVPAFVLIAIGGVMCFFSSLPVGFIFPENKNLIFTVASCLFDASSIIFLIFYRLTLLSLSFTRKSLFLGYACLTAFVMILLIWQWRYMEPHFRFVQKTIKQSSHGGTQHSTQGETDDIERAVPSSKIVPQPIMEEIKVEDVENVEEIREIEVVKKEVLKTTSEIVQETLTASNAENGVDEPTKRQKSISLAQKRIPEQIKSFEFFSISIYACIHIFRSGFYLGTNALHLVNLGDAETDYLYTNIFSMVLPFGFLFIPILPRMLSKIGFVSTLHVVNILGITYSLATLVNSLQFQIAVFIAFVMYRAFLFSILASFSGHVFGPRSMGRIHGSVFLLASIFNFLQNSVLIITNTYFEGKFSVINITLASLCALLIPLLEMLRKKLGQRDSAQFSY